MSERQEIEIIPNHTPGPWKVEPMMGENDLTIILDYKIDGEGYPIPIGFAFDESELDGVVTRESAKANASLIAQAPQMQQEIVRLREERDEWRSIAKNSCACEIGDPRLGHPEHECQFHRELRERVEALAEAVYKAYSAILQITVDLDNGIAPLLKDIRNRGVDLPAEIQKSLRAAIDNVTGEEREQLEEAYQACRKLKVEYNLGPTPDEIQQILDEADRQQAGGSDE